MATTTIAQTRTPQLSRLQTFGIVAGVIGIALLALGYFTDTQQFAESYLFGTYYTMAFPLGCLGLLLLQHLTGGAWAVTVRRILEAGAITMPIMFILFLPNILTAYNFYGLEHYVYEWANPSVVIPGGEEFDPIIAHKTPWLSPLWYTGRVVIYFALWSLFALLLRTWSRQQDRGDTGATSRMRMLSGIGVALFVITVTFASFDWSMSLDPHWFSTIYGAHYMVNAGLSVLAFLILVLTMVRDTPLYQEHVNIKPIHDIGKLMLAFTVLWTYMSYGQYVIIWSGDVAEFTPWYVDRGQGGWLVVAMGLMALSFFLPFFLLLGRKPKKNLNYLAGVAILILVMRFVDVSWIVLPSFHETVAQISWMDLAAPAGLLGIWLAMFAFNVQRAPLLPLNDHNMENLHAGGHH
jgi:hypothetical protein